MTLKQARVFISYTAEDLIAHAAGAACAINRKERIAVDHRF